LKLANLAAGLRVPDADQAVEPTAGDEAPVGRVADAPTAWGVLQRREFAAVQCPLPDGAVLAAANEALAVGRNADSELRPGAALPAGLRRARPVGLNHLRGGRRSEHGYGDQYQIKAWARNGHDNVLGGRARLRGERSAQRVRAFGRTPSRRG